MSDPMREDSTGRMSTNLRGRLEGKPIDRDVQGCVMVVVARARIEPPQLDLKQPIPKAMPSCDGQERGNKPGNTKKSHLYLADSKERLGIIHAAIILLESSI
jgi:hypothetical protein